MEKDEQKDVYKVYNRIGNWFAENRNQDLMEQKYLDKLISLIPTDAKILDIGCGNGKPMLAYLIGKKFKVIGIDASHQMIQLAKQNFPDIEFLLQDMRQLNLDQKFEALIAWHSFFHLPSADQPLMFEVFKKHLKPGGILMFTSGTENGEAWGLNGGENLFHASLSTAEYDSILKNHGFKVLVHHVSDPECGNATVWLAQYNPE